MSLPTAPNRHTGCTFAFSAQKLNVQYLRKLPTYGDIADVIFEEISDASV